MTDTGQTHSKTVTEMRNVNPKTGLSLLHTRKHAVVALRFVILALLALMALYQTHVHPIPLAPFIIVGIYGLSNVLLLIQRQEQIQTRGSLAVILILDVIVVSLFALSLGVKLVEFYTVYFITIMLAATSRKVIYALATAFVAAVIYAALAYSGRISVDMLSSSFAIRIVLFFATALFVGYLAEEGRKERLARRMLDRFARQKESEARRTSESLDHFIRLYEAVTESIPSALLLCDPGLNLLFYNEKMGELIDVLSDLKITDTTMDEPYELVDKIGIKHDFQQVAESGMPIEPKRLVKTALDGSTRSFRYRVYPIIDSSEKLVFIMAVLDDFTDIELANEKLQASEARFRGLFENAGNGIIIFMHGTGQILETNPAAEKLLLKSRSELLATSIWDLIPKSQVHEIQKDFDTKIASRQGIFAEISVQGEDGETILEVHVHPVQYAGSKAAQAVLIDTTARRLKLELERSKAAEEAAQGEVETERKVIRELERINSLKTSFMSVVTHELRTPMTSIRGAIELLIGELGEKMQSSTEKYLDIAIRNIDRLSALINDVLDISRIESGRLKLNRRMADLRPVVAEAIDTCRGSAVKRGTKLEFDAPQNEVSAYFDHNHIIQVLVNLVGNAIKYTPDQSKVWITLEKHDTEITVSVNDNGEGLASEELGMIFDAFYQVSKKANSPVKGTGLGLAICQGIVEAHNGRIWAESEPGRGASFKFALPARETRNEH